MGKTPFPLWLFRLHSPVFQWRPGSQFIIYTNCVHVCIIKIKELKPEKRSKNRPHNEFLKLNGRKRTSVIFVFMYTCCFASSINTFFWDMMGSRDQRGKMVMNKAYRAVWRSHCPEFKSCILPHNSFDSNFHGNCLKSFLVAFFDQMVLKIQEKKNMSIESTGEQHPRVVEKI